MRKYLLATVLITLLATACEKDTDLTRATVLDTGNISNEGCGYILQLEDGTQLKPKYLPSSYQHHGDRVKVKYAATDESSECFADSSKKKFFAVITIEDIKRDLD